MKPAIQRLAGNRIVCASAPHSSSGACTPAHQGCFFGSLKAALGSARPLAGPVTQASVPCSAAQAATRTSAQQPSGSILLLHRLSGVPSIRPGHRRHVASLNLPLWASSAPNSSTSPALASVSTQICSSSVSSMARATGTLAPRTSAVAPFSVQGHRQHFWHPASLLSQTRPFSSSPTPAPPPPPLAPSASTVAAAAAGTATGAVLTGAVTAGAAAGAVASGATAALKTGSVRKRFSKRRVMGAVAMVTVLSGAAFVSTREPGVISEWSFRAFDVLPPLLRVLDPETAHELAILAVSLGAAPQEHRPDPPSLSCSLWGRTFRNPLGLAAGWDKDARAVEGILSMGLGFMEVGSVTPAPQKGNPKPRMFRLPEQKAVINRYGFNSEGVPAVAARLGVFHGRRQALEGPDAKSGGKRPSLEVKPSQSKGDEEESSVAPPPAAASAPFLAGQLGVNLGKNKWTVDSSSDYVQGVYTLAQYADFLVINVSSPNTPGLRKLQGRKQLHDLVKKVVAARNEMQWGEKGPPPLLVKVAPDLTEQDMQDIAQVALNVPLDGLVVGNTTVTRPDSVLGLLHVEEAGGLSGKPLFDQSTRVLAHMYALTKGKIPIIGCGGVMSGEDAYRKIRAGASLVQIYTALVYEGLGVIPRIKKELAQCLERDGFSNVAEAVGADHPGIPRPVR